MNTELANSFVEVFKPAAENLRAMSLLNIATVEKVVAVQLASAKANAELTVSNLKAGVEVSDLDAAKAYLTSQNEIVKTVYDRMIADGKALAGIAKTYGEEATKLVKQAVPVSAPALAVVPSRAKKAA